MDATTSWIRWKTLVPFPGWFENESLLLQGREKDSGKKRSQSAMSCLLGIVTSCFSLHVSLVLVSSLCWLAEWWECTLRAASQFQVDWWCDSQLFCCRQWACIGEVSRSSWHLLYSLCFCMLLWSVFTVACLLLSTLCFTHYIRVGCMHALCSLSPIPSGCWLSFPG